jgi:erythrin-vacuolar iron transport family protein
MMLNEQDKILEALSIAIEMENDGKECYQQASQISGNEVGRKLLQSLAIEEDTHRQTLVEMYQAMQKSKNWPVTAFKPDGGKRLRQLFTGTCELIGVNVKAVTTEFDALNLAIDKEKKSFDFYNHQSRNAIYDSERNFYRALAAEEKEHELILVDYFEYLTDPIDWFTRTEHHSLDGG